MLRPIALLAVSLMTVCPAIAADPAPRIAKKDGFRFEYTTALRSDDHVHIYGRDLDRSDRFSLIVAPDGRVTGTFGHAPVSFTVRRQVRDRMVASLKRAQPVSVAQSSAPALATASAE